MATGWSVEAYSSPTKGTMVNDAFIGDEKGRVDYHPARWHTDLNGNSDPTTYVLFVKNRMDRRHVESCAGLHQDKSRLQALLRGDLR